MASTYDEPSSLAALKLGAAMLVTAHPTTEAAIRPAVEAVDRAVADKAPVTKALRGLRIAYLTEVASILVQRSRPWDAELERPAHVGLLDEEASVKRVSAGGRPPEDVVGGNCETCFAEPVTLVGNAGCGHAFCSECWQGFVRSELEATTRSLLTCMGAVGTGLDKCPEPVSDNVLRVALRAEDFDGLVAERAAVSDAAVPPGLLAVAAALPTVGVPLRQALATEPVPFYHYTLCGEEDIGWGCAYRCAQMVLASMVARGLASPPMGRDDWVVPHLLALQFELASVGAIKAVSIGSHLWIEPPQICTLLTERYGVQGADAVTLRRSETEDTAFVARLFAHFEGRGTPVVIDDRVMAYVVAGVRERADGVREVLVLNPHFRGRLTHATLSEHAFAVSWKPLHVAMAASTWLVLFP